MATSSRLLDLGLPQTVWDVPGAEAVRSADRATLRFKQGELQRVVWLAWTGSNKMPDHLELCVETIRRNCGLETILVTPDNLSEFVPDPHPAYASLHLAHRADYLRCCLLHHYGGIYLDVDTICLRSLAPLFDRLETLDAVGYDGSPWGEFVGISAMGPFRPRTELTTLWFEMLHGKLEQKRQEKAQSDFYWQELLRDIFLPVSLMHQAKIGKHMLASNPEKEQLWAVRPMQEALDEDVFDGHVVILNNAKYGHELKPVTARQIMGGPAVLSQLLRWALGQR